MSEASVEIETALGKSISLPMCAVKPVLWLMQDQHLTFSKAVERLIRLGLEEIEERRRKDIPLISHDEYHSIVEREEKKRVKRAQGN